MLKKSESKKIRIFKSFFLSYILVLILPFVFGSFIYYEALGIIEKDAKDARIFMLKQSRAIIDNYLKDIDRTALSMSMNTYVKNLMYMDQPGYGSSDIYYLTQTQKEIKSYNTSSTFESSYYIFFKQGDMVLTRYEINFGIQQYYANSFRYSGMEYGDWHENVLDTYHEREINPVSITNYTANLGTTTDYLNYIQSFPIGSGNKTLGAILILIRREDINKLLTDVDESRSGYTFILDRDGKLVTGVSNSGDGSFPDIAVDREIPTGFTYKKINGTDMAVIYIKSAYNGWTYVTALPTKVFMDKAIYIKKVIGYIVGISLLIGVVISIYLTRRNIRPIREMLVTLRKVFQGELSSGKNEYEFLKNGVARLINTHEEMKRSMENQEILMKSTFLSRLIRGEISDEREIELLSGHLGINLKGKKHAAAILVLNRFPDRVNREMLIEHDINRVIIDNVINKYTGGRCNTYILDADQIILLLNFNTDDGGECEKIIENLLAQIIDELHATFNINVNLGVGNLYEKIADINLSFSEAKNTLALFDEIGGDNAILWYKDVKKELYGYYYPVELEQQLINMAKSGNKSDIDRLMDMIYSKNFIERRLTNYMEYNLFFDMRGTIIKTCEEINGNQDLKEIISSKYSTMSVQDVFASMKKAYYQICSEAGNKKRSHNDQLLNKLVEYIQSNYFSPEVSACDIASRFDISESYFSQFFKEQSGETFSNYLEKLRIGRACELLDKKDLSVEHTAKFVGYNSAYTFRRAFKRVMGILPTEYRH